MIQNCPNEADGHFLAIKPESGVGEKRKGGKANGEIKKKNE